MLRWIIVESARVASTHDPRLRSFYERVRSRRGDQKAIIATANKMLKIVWLMLTRREAYESANRKRYIVLSGNDFASMPTPPALMGPSMIRTVASLHSKPCMAC
jgi:hypothetical protein